jgi:mannosyltransferase OCH1-like enzyme
LQSDVVIPSKVWQTAKSSVMPEALYNSTSSWRRLNPDFEVQFHDDAAVQEVIALNFNNEILEMFSAFPVSVMKVRTQFYAPPLKVYS